MTLEKTGTFYYYIGSSVDCETRVKHHKYRTLQPKYPDYNFIKWEVLEEVPPSAPHPCQTKGYLLWLETKIGMEWREKYGKQVLNIFPMTFVSNGNFLIAKKK